MELIMLNEFGDALDFDLFSDQSKMRVSDPHEALRPIAEHVGCGRNYVYCTPISETHNAICCARCNLRFPIPREIDAREKLREWCEQEIKNRDAESMRLEMLWRSRAEQIESAAGVK